MRPLLWARGIAGRRFTPALWGPGVFLLEAPGGAHLLVRRHGAPELALWLPDGMAPAAGEAFGLYLHADRHHRDRTRATSLLARGIGRGLPLRRTRHPQAHRLAAMLCVHDMMGGGATLQDVAATLLDPAPGDWRASSERSDLRRLVTAGDRMIAGGYRLLLRPRSRCD